MSDDLFNLSTELDLTTGHNTSGETESKNVLS